MVLITEALFNLKIQNNKKNKLFERARPLRLVAPLSAQAQGSFLERTLAWVEISQAKTKADVIMLDALINWNSQLTKSTLLQ